VPSAFAVNVRRPSFGGVRQVYQKKGVVAQRPHGSVANLCVPCGCKVGTTHQFSRSKPSRTYNRRSKACGSARPKNYKKRKRWLVSPSVGGIDARGITVGGLSFGIREGWRRSGILGVERQATHQKSYRAERVTQVIYAGCSLAESAGRLSSARYESWQPIKDTNRGVRKGY
jgi:hypothetical protein